MEDLYLGPLPTLGLITAEGADAAALLQGQLCGDVHTVSAQQGLHTALNSPKGRMLATLDLWQQPPGFWLGLHRDTVATTLARLRMFILRSDVRLEAADAAPRVRALMGKGAMSWLSDRGWPIPAEPLAVTAAAGLSIARRPGDHPRFLLLGDAATIAALPARNAEPLPAAWHRAEMAAGVATVYPATRDHFIPQMAGLDRLGGISFTKGCFTGQEVIARLHYLGQAKRSAYHACSTAAAAPGDSITTADGSSAGEVIDAAVDGAHHRLLVVLQDAQAGTALEVNKTPLFDLQPVSRQSDG